MSHPLSNTERECWIIPAAFGLAQSFRDSFIRCNHQIRLCNVVAMKINQVFFYLIFTYDTFLQLTHPRIRCWRFFFLTVLDICPSWAEPSAFCSCKACTHGESCEPGVACALWCRDWATGALPSPVTRWFYWTFMVGKYHWTLEGLKMIIHHGMFFDVLNVYKLYKQ